MEGNPSEYFLVQILDNGGKSEFKWVINFSLFFFFLWSSVSLCICVEGEEMMWSIKKLRFDFEATNVLCCPLDRYDEKVMAIMQTYGDGQTGGGLSKSSASVLARARKQGRFLIMIWSFSWQRWSRLQPMPPLPLATSLKLVHSFFYHSSFVLLKEAPQGFCSMLARAPA